MSKEVNNIIDHLFDKVGENLPKPVFKRPSIIFGLKNASIVFAVFLTLGFILSIYFGFIKKKSYIITTTNYDKKGKIKNDDTKTVDEVPKELDQDKCEKVYKNDILRKKVCINKQFSLSGIAVFIITSIIGLISSIFTFKVLFNFHYGKALRSTNVNHDVFIDYARKLFEPYF
jgi:hypothetical protein